MPKGTIHAYGIRSVGAGAGALASVALLAAPTGEAERAATGGVPVVTRPHIKSVKCTAGCGAHGRVVTGGTVRLKGRDLSGAKQVIFLGGDGTADDASVPVTPTSDHRLDVRVPYSAGSGPLTAWVSSDVQSEPSRSLKIVPAPAPHQTGKLRRATGPTEPGAPKVKTAVSSGRAYVGGSGVGFWYRITGVGAAHVVVTVVRLSDDAVVRTWNQGTVASGDVRALSWNTKDHGNTPPDDRYAFRLTASAGGAATKNAADDDQTRDAFDLHGYAFPIHGHHTYGDGFGAPRAGHRHQGQDIIASCGTPILAVRGGRVKVSKYHPAAGNYIVVDGVGTGYDFLYAHLPRLSPLKVGEHVYTGERIGDVGETGDAVGCHLHFETWTPPGWYSGGHPFDPEPLLKAWDRYS